MIQKQGTNMTMAGRVVKDVEAKRVGEKQIPRASFGIGTGEQQITNVVAWRELAEFAGTLKKGDHVFAAGIEGVPREYNGKEYRDITLDVLIKQPKAGREPGEEFPHDLPARHSEFDSQDMQETDESMPF